MKKVLLVVLFAVLAASLAMATGPTNYIPSTDVLGAHNNGGRGCAACHAPHSGGRGNGGNSAKGTGGVGAEGDWHLWGTDLSVITAVPNLQFGYGYNSAYYGVDYNVVFGGGQWTPLSNNLIGGIAICLSCHDGNVSEGGMMLNQAYEYNNNLLPVGVGGGYAGKTLYGNNAPIPTLLGNDGGTAGDYLNDHPVGYNANFNMLNYPQPLQNYGLSFTTTVGNYGTSVAYTVTGSSAYASFVANYGMPGILGMQVDSTNQTPYVVCTTCHNQHQMNVFLSGTGQAQIANDGGSFGYKTLFFVNAPYNAASAWGPMAAPSTTQFCRQCHFGVANEAFGQTGVTTAF